ncbi:MAG: hypothetical protein NC131_03960 [Roseburia sp.]|nr:hypothetical protein [Roseburia sp.]
MDKNFKKKLTEEMESYEELKNEPRFSATDFTQEIFLLLDDYFRGEFIFDGKEIKCTFGNGQKFILKADEIK